MARLHLFPFHHHHHNGRSMASFALFLMSSFGTVFGQQFLPTGMDHQQRLWPADPYEYAQQPQRQFTGSIPHPQQPAQSFYNPYPQWPDQQPPLPPPRILYTVPRQPHHRLPYPRYRGDAATVDQAQRDRLSRIAAESESFGGHRSGGFFGAQNIGEKYSTPNNDNGGLQRLLATVAEKLPKIAETMAGLSNNARAPTTTDVAKNGEAESGQIGQKPIGHIDTALRLPRREYGTEQQASVKQEEVPLKNGEAALIDTMPEPPSMFSFNKLLSVFGAAGDSSGKVAPVLRSVDLEPALAIQKDKLYELLSTTERAHLTPPAEPPPTPAPNNPFGTLLQQFGLPNLVVPNSSNPAKTAAAEQLQQQQQKTEEDSNNNGDLFGSLMKGKLPQMPDWLRQFGLEQLLSANGTRMGASKSDAEVPMDHGNALAQLFGGKNGGGGGKGFALSSVFGSGLDDAPRR